MTMPDDPVEITVLPDGNIRVETTLPPGYAEDYDAYLESIGRADLIAHVPDPEKPVV